MRIFITNSHPLWVVEVVVSVFLNQEILRHTIYIFRQAAQAHRIESCRPLGGLALFKGSEQGEGGLTEHLTARGAALPVLCPSTGLCF